MFKNRFFNLKIRFRAAVLAALTFTGAFGIYSGTVSYAVKIDGETVGTVESVDTARIAVGKTEEMLTETLGYEYSIETEITPVFAASNMSEDELSEEMIEKLAVTPQKWGISVDGELVGACETRDAAEAIVQEKLDMFVGENTTGVFLVQEVSIDPVEDEDILTDEAEISSLLDPKNEDSDVALQVIVTETETEARLVPYETEYTYTADMYDDTEERTVKGFDGAAMATVEVEYLNGSEIQRKDIDVEVVSEPITEEITKGTTPRPRTASYGEYIWPVDGHVTSLFGPRHIRIGSSNHTGLDIAVPYGTPIAAADGGEVISAAWAGGYGKLVQIRHDNGQVTYYAHCSGFAVKAGQRVARGETIAYAGSTGNSTGNHVHFEVRINDKPQNPLNYLP